MTRDPCDFAPLRSDARASPRPRKWRGALCRGERATQTRGVLKGNKNPVEKTLPKLAARASRGEKRRHTRWRAKPPWKIRCWGVCGVPRAPCAVGSLLGLGVTEQAGRGGMESGFLCGFCISKYKKKIGLFCFRGALDECGGRDAAWRLHAPKEKSRAKPSLCLCRKCRNFFQSFKCQKKKKGWSSLSPCAAEDAKP